jgi:hypothetical protein
MMKVLKRVPNTERNGILVPILLNNKKAMHAENLNYERNRSKVMFAPLIEVCVFQPIIDPQLKAMLYYSREELYIIHKQIQLACLFLRTAKKQEMLKKFFKERELIMDDLHQNKSVPRTKRLIETPSETTRKRQRRRSVLV